MFLSIEWAQKENLFKTSSLSFAQCWGYKTKFTGISILICFTAEFFKKDLCNFCKLCSTTKSKARLSCRHILSGHGIDFEKNVKTSLQLAHEAFDLLKEIQGNYKSEDNFDRKNLKLNKIKIIKKFDKIKNYWNNIYNIIVNMIWE